MSSEGLGRRILEFLRENPGASIKDIAGYLGVSVNLARAVVYRLRSSGLVEKVGNTYILTPLGERIFSREKSRVKEKLAAKTEVQAKVEGAKPQEYVKEASRGEEEARRIEEASTEDFRGLIEKLESKLKLIEREVAEVKRELEVLKRMTSVKKKVEAKLSKPVMSFIEAEKEFGPEVKSLVYTGKAVVIGSLIVDKEFYEEFKRRFPIKKSEVNNLSIHERMLLEELVRTGQAYLYCGREYRII